MTLSRFCFRLLLTFLFSLPSLVSVLFFFSRVFSSFSLPSSLRFFLPNLLHIYRHPQLIIFVPLMLQKQHQPSLIYSTIQQQQQRIKPANDSNHPCACTTPRQDTKLPEQQQQQHILTSLSSAPLLAPHGNSSAHIPINNNLSLRPILTHARVHCPSLLPAHILRPYRQVHLSTSAFFCLPHTWTWIASICPASQKRIMAYPSISIGLFLMIFAAILFCMCMNTTRSIKILPYKIVWWIWRSKYRGLQNMCTQAGGMLGLQD